MLTPATGATEATELTTMRLLGKDCGCDARKDIIFDAGKIGAPEAAILVLAMLAVGFALTYHKIGGPSA